MSKGKDTVKETSQERALADVSSGKWDRYEKVLKPFESILMKEVLDVEPKRQRALGVAAGSTQQAFARAGGKVDRSLEARGAKPGSGKFAGTQADFSLDRGKALGLGLNDASDLVERQGIAGKQSLVDMGKGKSAAAIRGFGESARRAVTQAEMDAEAAAGNRAAGASAAGAVAGLGISALTAPGEMGPMERDAASRGGLMDVDQAQVDWERMTGN